MLKGFSANKVNFVYRKLLHFKVCCTVRALCFKPH